jgi:hypothetical protein
VTDKARKRYRLSAKQKSLLALLRKRAGKTVSESEILKATDWKPSSWRVYRNNALYAPFLRETTPGNFEVTLDPHISDDEFRRQITQTRQPGSAIKSPLARALVSRSRDNIVLALEVYNRPTLVNRLDAFAILFTTAWEQLLKAELIEKHNEDHIFRPKKPGRRRESIGVDECLDQVLTRARDPVRLNIERIAELRHSATHLVMPELQPSFARLFQAGVLNFSRRFREKTGMTVVPRQSVGLLVLAAPEDRIDAASLKKLYGDEVAAELLEFAKTVDDEAAKINDARFAIPVEYTLRFATRGEEPDVSLVRATEAPVGAVIFEKSVDPERIYPLRTQELEQLISRKIPTKFNNHDLQSVLHKEKWKKSDNEFHRFQRNPDTHKYSHKAADAIVEKIRSDANYLSQARESYRRHLARHTGKP